MRKILYILIVLESGFILFNYYPEIEMQALFPALIYSALAVTDTIAKDRRFSILVLLVSIGIAIPRLMLQYSNLTQKTAETKISESNNDPAPDPYIPQIQNCEILSQWEISKCMENNRIENSKKIQRDDEIRNFILNQNKNARIIKSEKKLDLAELAIFMLLGIVSVSLPAGIFFLIHPPPVELTREEKLLKSIQDLDDIAKVQILLQNGFDWKQTAKDSRIIDNHVSISRATYYRKIEKNKRKPKIFELKRNEDELAKKSI